MLPFYPRVAFFLCFAYTTPNPGPDSKKERK